jgi:hypothetical protein
MVTNLFSQVTSRAHCVAYRLSLTSQKANFSENFSGVLCRTCTGQKYDLSKPLSYRVTVTVTHLNGLQLFP